MTGNERQIKHIVISSFNNAVNIKSDINSNVCKIGNPFKNALV